MDIEINPTNEFHVLRHFSHVDDAYKETLIGESYRYYDYARKKYRESVITEADIENALETIGTKFFEDVAGIENPRKLLELVGEKFPVSDGEDKMEWTADGEGKTASFSFAYGASVGLINALPKQAFSADEIKRVKRSRCPGEDDVWVETVSGTELKPTDKIHVEITDTPLLPFCAVTAFPDCAVDDPEDDGIVFVTN